MYYNANPEKTNIIHSCVYIEAMTGNRLRVLLLAGSLENSKLCQTTGKQSLGQRNSIRERVIPSTRFHFHFNSRSNAQLANDRGAWMLLHRCQFQRLKKSAVTARTEWGREEGGREQEKPRFETLGESRGVIQKRDAAHSLRHAVALYGSDGLSGWCASRALGTYPSDLATRP